MTQALPTTHVAITFLPFQHISIQGDDPYGLSALTFRGILYA
jgi:hypothetical protein